MIDFSATEFLLIVLSSLHGLFSQHFLIKINTLMNIYVSNLSFNVQDEDLRDYFEDYGEVTSAKVITDKFTNRSRGFGFVEMTDDAAAEKAIKELNGAMVDGRSISVSVAKPREERSNNNKRSFSNSNSNSNSRW